MPSFAEDQTVEKPSEGIDIKFEHVWVPKAFRTFGEISGLVIAVELGVEFMDRLT